MLSVLKYTTIHVNFKLHLPEWYLMALISLWLLGSVLISSRPTVFINSFSFSLVYIWLSLLSKQTHARYQRINLHVTSPTAADVTLTLDVIETRPLVKLLAIQNMNAH
jgi:hypothetical protein